MIIEVNWDSLEEVTKLYQRCKSRSITLDSTRVTKASINRDKYEAARNIWEYDLKDLYKDQGSETYYVYAHCDHRKPVTRTKRDWKAAFSRSLGLLNFPFYIGKGKGNRYLNTNRNGTHRKVKQSIIDSGGTVDCCIIEEGLSENKALELEAKLIDIFGVIGKSGSLVNLDEGTSVLARRSKYLSDYKILHN